MIEVSLQINVPQDIDIEQAIIRSAEAALAEQGAAGNWLSATVADDEYIQTLNRDYRGIDRPTDVLSFPMEEGDDIAAVPDGFLGDIVLSLPRAKAQAEEYGHSLLREISFLTVHGTLHLLGYDHMNEAEAALMFAKQEDILNKMGVLR